MSKTSKGTKPAIKKKRLEALLIERLASRPWWEAKQLHLAISTQNRSCSLQGVYHELLKLQERGVILKTGTRYSLNILWVQEMLDFGERLARWADSAIASLPESLAQSRKTTLRFSSLKRMDAAYLQLTLALMQHAPEGPILEWLPHPWFMLTQIETEVRFKRALERSKRHLYVLQGGASALDRAWRASRESSLIRYSQSTSRFASDGNKYWTVIGSYVVQCTISPAIAARIDTIFNEARRVTESDVLAVTRLAEEPCKAVIHVENNPAKAKRLLSYFKQHFGFV